jgi:hypothetical protein
MGCLKIFLPQLGPLSNAKTMLFIDDNQSQVPELNRVFDQGVGAYQDMKAAGGKVFADERPFFPGVDPVSNSMVTGMSPNIFLMLL